MNIDAYRSCTWREKRDVLNVFWRTNAQSSARLDEAAVQYGYYCLICLYVVIIEIALILAAALRNHALMAGLAVASELFVLWSTWWALKRYRTLKSQPVNVATA